MQAKANTSKYSLAWGLLLAVLVLTIVVYLPMFQNEWVAFDNNEYVVFNPRVGPGLSWSNLAWAFTHTHSGNWHPLTWISLQLDASLFGLKTPRGFLLTNLLLHAANAGLLFLFLNRATRLAWPSALVSALFGLHPLHVESVAWVAERKDTLSTFFWHLTMLLYLHYAQAPSRARYLLVCAGLSVGLLAKSMLVTLPCVLWLLDYWPLHRFELATATGRRQAWKLLLEKLPLFLPVFGCIVLTVNAQADTIASLDRLPLSVRLVTALWAYGAYLGKMLLPVDLSPLYYHWSVLERTPWLQLAGSAVVVLTVSGLAWRYRAKLPYLLVGWCWYLGTLVPVIGLVQVGSQCLADRYTYVPLTGVFFALVWLGAELVQQKKLKPSLAYAITGLTLLAYALLTPLQSLVWGDEISFWRQVQRANPKHIEAVTAHATALLYKRDYDEADKLLRQAILVHGKHPNIRARLALLDMQRDKKAEAKRELSELADLLPNESEVHGNLAYLQHLDGEFAQAVPNYRVALASKPYMTGFKRGLAVALFHLEEWEEAEALLTEISRLEPTNAIYSADLGWLHHRLGRPAEADLAYAQTTRYAPNWLKSYKDQLEKALHPQSQRRTSYAVLRYQAEQICQATHFQDPSALDLLAGVCAVQEQFEKAVEYQRQALEQTRVETERTERKAKLTKYQARVR